MLVFRDRCARNPRLGCMARRGRRAGAVATKKLIHSGCRLRIFAMRIASLKALLLALSLAAPVALFGCGDTSTGAEKPSDLEPDIQEEEDTETPIEKSPGEV